MEAVLFPLLLIIYASLCAVARLSRHAELGNIFRWIFYGLLWLTTAVYILFGLLLMLLRTPASAGISTPQMGIGILVVGILSALVLLLPVRRLLGRVMPLLPESPLHTLGLFIIIPVIATFGSILVLITPQELLAQMKRTDAFQSTGSTQLGFVALALIGIGWGYARNTQQTKERLGLGPVSKKQVGLAIGIACGMFLILTLALDPLLRIFFPVNTEFQESIMRLMRPGKTTGNIPLEILLMSLMAGTGEEILFRGLMFPIFGIVGTAVLFTLIHVQYGIGSGVFIVLCCGLLLGYLRQRYNTTFAIIVHATYDILAFSAATYLMK